MNIDASLLPMNPWSTQETFFEIDMLDFVNEIDFKFQFEKFGIIRVKNFFSWKEVDEFVSIFQSKSGLAESDYEKARSNPQFTYSFIGGITQTEELWNLVLNKKLIQLLEKILGQNQVRYYFDDKIGINLPSYSFHPDIQTNSKYADYTHFENASEIKTIRCIHYFHRQGRQSTRFGFVPFSHKSDPLKFKNMRLNNEDLNPIWLESGARDLILFHPMLQHTGDKLNSSKYMAVTTWDTDNSYAIENFYRVACARKVTANKVISQKFKDKLSDFGILPITLKKELYQEWNIKIKSEGKIINQSNQIEYRQGEEVNN